jgi:hypothetical protein
MADKDFRQPLGLDGSPCCLDERPGCERCSECRHYLTFIYDKVPEDGALNCTNPDCPTNDWLRCQGCGSITRSEDDKCDNVDCSIGKMNLAEDEQIDDNDNSTTS